MLCFDRLQTKVNYLRNTRGWDCSPRSRIPISWSHWSEGWVGLRCPEEQRMCRMAPTTSLSLLPSLPLPLSLHISFHLSHLTLITTLSRYGLRYRPMREGEGVTLIIRWDIEIERDRERRISWHHPHIDAVAPTMLLQPIISYRVAQIFHRSQNS